MSLNNSILKRTFVYFIFFAIVILAVVFYLFINDLESIPFWVLIVSLVVFLFYFLLVYFVEIVRPLKILLFEMKKLLTGRSYRRIYTNRVDEIGVISHFFNEVTKSIEKVTLDIREGRRMSGELEIAGELQKEILPEENPNVFGLDIVARNRPAVELGGDNFDFIKSGDNTYIYIGDVTGHGVPAALIMTMANTLIHTFVEIYNNAYDVLVNTNKQLKSRVRSTMFMSMVMLKWDEVKQKMTYVGCGHEYLLVYRAKTGKCESKPSGGIALGMVPDNSKLIKEIDLDLEIGDCIVLYTDGITEARNMSGEMYSLNRLIKSIERYAVQYGPDGIVNYVAKDFSHFVEEQVQDDDVTLIAIQYVGSEKNNDKSQIKSTKWT